MGNVETRQIQRDSLFLLANLRLDGQEQLHRVKVRNLSAGGMMAEGPVRVAHGDGLTIELRNIGWVEGSVAWVQDNRFGIAFHHDVDPQLARARPEPSETNAPRFVRPPLTSSEPVQRGQIRKI
ncbi:MAG: PilZ domain-containing protein [Novosphingobium sp.]|jgi:hypothetical protein